MKPREWRTEHRDHCGAVFAPLRLHCTALPREGCGGMGYDPRYAGYAWQRGQR